MRTNRHTELHIAEAAKCFTAATVVGVSTVESTVTGDRHATLYALSALVYSDPQIFAYLNDAPNGITYASDTSFIKTPHIVYKQCIGYIHKMI